MLRTLEQEMLKQMGKSGHAGMFVLRTHMVHDVDCDDRRGVVWVNDHAQTVVEASVGDREMFGVS